MRESKIQEKIIKWLKGNGWFVLKIIQLTENGFPDVYCFKRGRTVWFECKATGKKVKEDGLQQLRLNQLIAAGMEAYQVNSLEEVKKYIACK